RDFVRRLGVDLAQGYFFARPMKPVDAEALLRRVTKEAETVRRLKASAPPPKHAEPLYLTTKGDTAPLDSLAPLDVVTPIDLSAPAPTVVVEPLGSAFEDLLLHEVEAKPAAN